MEDNRGPIDLEDDFAAVERAREQLVGVDGVHHVSLGATCDADGQNLERAIWVHVTADVPELDRRDEFDLPLVVVDLTRDDENPGAGADLAGPNLSGRGNPPVGGFQVGPNQTKRGTFGLFGYLSKDKKSKPVDHPAMITAAHTFANGDGSYYPIVRQPATGKRGDVIGDRPVTDLANQDVIIYRVDKSAREWEWESKVAYLGEVPTLAEPRSGMDARKVGFQTGRTSGVITSVNPPHFAVRPADSTDPISKPGDSGAAWVTKVFEGENWDWLGIHKGRLPDKEVAVGVSWRYVFDNSWFQPFG